VAQVDREPCGTRPDDLGRGDLLYAPTVTIPLAPVTAVMGTAVDMRSCRQPLAGKVAGAVVERSAA
jgi:hypothetical protein